MPGDEVLEWLDRRARELDESELRAILAALAPVVIAVPELAADEDLAAETSAATREMMRLLIVSALPGSAPPAGGAPPAALVSLVRTWAQRGVDLSVLMRGYRSAHAEFWRYWMADVTARENDPELRMAVLEHCWARVSEWHELQLAQLEAIYAQQRDRWLRGAQARRAETIRLLLGGEVVDGETASATLGYDLRRVHAAIVLWTDGEPDGDALAVLEDAARELARRVEGGRPLSLAAGAHAVWAWIPVVGGALGTNAHDRADGWLPDGVRVAVGRAAPGVEGFRTSHQDAQLVRRVMALAARPPRLVSFDEVELVCLISGEPEAMRRLVAHELGELATRDPNVARLRETARVYLACGANAREAAERLTMHKNTVHYRLSRIEDLLGHPITERRLELEVALTLVHTLGDRILPQG
jgi:hypothetical protein